jgi:hypothetical protein
VIYILQPTAGGGIKFGSSVFPAMRKTSIQGVFPYGVEILATMDGHLLGETFLCRCFEPLSMGGPSREWFFPRPQVWRFILDVIDNGRPSWLPSESRDFNAYEAAIEMFGDKARAMSCLGYAPTTDAGSTLHGWSGRGRVLFAMALRDGMLPEYVAELHRPQIYEAA